VNFLVIGFSGEEKNMLKLGRKALQTDSRTLKLGKYLKALAPPPLSADWTGGQTDWGMMLNDTLGCCTISACGHAVQVMTKAVGAEVTVPDHVIENEYSWWDGYVPGDPNTDLGGIPIQVLNSWRKHGFNGFKLKAYADPSVSSLDEIRQSIALFGGAYIGLNVPNYVMNNLTAPGSTWDVEDDNGIAGGHCVFVCKYDATTFTFISWGSLYSMTIPFWNRFVDESHTLLSPDWFNSTKLSASGFDWDQLWADLGQIQ
jgi:hypothetical protein